MFQSEGSSGNASPEEEVVEEGSKSEVDDEEDGNGEVLFFSRSVWFNFCVRKKPVKLKLLHHYFSFLKRVAGRRG